MKTKHTHWKQAFDSPYLGSWDLDDYKDVTLTIERAEQKLTDGLKENSIKNTLYFKEPGYKPMILNSTNSKVIKFLTKSPYIENWAGTRITIFVKTGVKAFGELHDALRIRKVTAELPALTPKHPNWNAAKESTATIEVVRKHYTITDANFKLLRS